MRTSLSGHAAYLVLGNPRLHTAPPASDEIIVLVPDLTAQADTTRNTVVVRFTDLPATRLLARTIDGRHRADAVLNCGRNLFDATLPGPVLHTVVHQITATRGEKDTEATKPVVPLWYCTITPGGVHVYSQIRFLPEDACFLRITPTPLPAANIEDLSWLAAAVQLHHHHAHTLGSHECQYQRCFPGQELEYKYTLPSTVDIWALAADTHRKLRAGQLPGYLPKYHDECERWDYLNHLFEIHSPEHERGYVSFIPTTNGTYLIKRKWFTKDTFARHEHITPETALDRPLTDHVRDVLHLDGQPLPPFRRLRYDINLESTHTGHVFTVLFDRCTLLDAPDVTLCQCEIEYVTTRTVLTPNADLVHHEINHLAQQVEHILAEHTVATTRSAYSKLSFLRHSVTRGLARNDT